MAEDRKILKICKICGKEFWGCTTKCYCSDECKGIGKKINVMKHREDEKNGVKRKKKQMSKLAEINEEARAAGMSYGKYVAWQKTEREREIAEAVRQAKNAIG